MFKWNSISDQVRAGFEPERPTNPQNVDLAIAGSRERQDQSVICCEPSLADIQGPAERCRYGIGMVSMLFTGRLAIQPG